MMKTQIAAVVLGLAFTSVYAAHTDQMVLPGSNPFKEVVEQPGMWSFGVDALLVQPSNTAFKYAYNDGSIYNVGNDYQWWFGADVTYTFANNGPDVALIYEGLYNSQGDNVSGNLQTGLNGTVGYTGGSNYTAANETSQINYDAFDLVLGKKFNAAQRVQLHPFVGVRYVYLDVQNNATYYNGSVNAETGVFENDELENKLNIVGPRLGGDAAFELGKGFSVRARAGASALIGTNNTRVNGAVYTGKGAFVQTAVEDNSSDTKVFPEMDGRLGLNYTCSLDPQTHFGVEVGWQAADYFNVLLDESQADGNGHYSSNSNFVLQGPYARLQLDIG